MKKTIVLILFCAVNHMTFAQTELTDENAEQHLMVNNDRLIVLDFYATWCGPCKYMEPIIEELENEYGSEVDFYKIDVDKSIVDDALGINAMPTYLFIKNSENLEQIEGAMSKARMEGLIKKHMGGSSSSSSSNSSYYDATANHDASNEFSDSVIYELKDDSSKLNSLAWHAYKEHNDINDLLQAIKIVELSIDLDANYYNLDTHAALLYKTGNYTMALKKAKEAIEKAKEDDVDYSSTSELIDKVIERL